MWINMDYIIIIAVCEFTMRIEEIPHPTATLAIHDRGGKSFETIVMGI